MLPRTWAASAGAVSETVGGVVSATCRSTVQVRDAGLGSVLPAGSVALTVNVWLPSARPVYVLGEVQAATLPPSSVQPNVEPVSLELNPKVAVSEVAVPDGPASIVVSGGPVSTVTVRAADAGGLVAVATVGAARVICLSTGVRVSALVHAR